MRRLAMLLTVLAAGATLVSAAAGAGNRALPPAGAYTFGARHGGFKITRQRNRVTNLRLTFTLDPATAILPADDAARRAACVG